MSRHDPAERVIWLAGWTLLAAVVAVLAAMVTLTFATVDEPDGRGEVDECRAYDVMLGRSPECDGWPTGRAIPVLVVVAAVAAWGVPERRRGSALTRMLGCLATIVAVLAAMVVVARTSFTPRGPTFLLLWAALLCAAVPAALLPVAVRRTTPPEIEAG